jgi:TPR repeat protein
MKTALIILLFVALLAWAQTNEPIVQVKFYSDPNRTNKVQLFSAPKEARWISGEVEGVYNKSGRIRVMIQGNTDSADFGKMIILQSYPDTSALAVGETTKIYARQIGTIMGVNRDGTDANGEVLELWEYVDRDAEMRELDLEIERHAQIQKAIAEKQKAIAKQKAAEKTFLVQSNVIRWLQPLATNGDASAQCSLGEHYLTGNGCETNRALAIKWLTTAAGNGDMEASNTLARLKP